MYSTVKILLYRVSCRIVVSGEIGSYIPISSVGVFQFDTEYGLTFEECLEVSDHYPVEFRLFSKFVHAHIQCML